MLNLRQIISLTQGYNFHSHTQFCDGRDTIESIARAAVDCGVEHLGFTPHSPIPIPSPCNMSMASFESYRREIERVGELTAGKCRIYMGMEIDYLGPEWGPAHEYFVGLGLDYAIGSVHFIPNQKGECVDIDGPFADFNRRMDEYFNGDVRYVVETYYAQSQAMLAAGCFDVLGHFDKIGNNASNFSPGLEDEAWYQRLVSDFIDQIIASGVIVEINTKARVDFGRFFPGERYWQRLIDAGVPLMVNSDAHYAQKLQASRDDAFAILKSMGYGC